MSAVSMMSFTPIGRPCSRPLRPARSSARAAASAASLATCVHAFTVGSRVAMRSRQASTIRSAVVSPASSLRRSSSAEASFSVLLIGSPLLLAHALRSPGQALSRSGAHPMKLAKRASFALLSISIGLIASPTSKLHAQSAASANPLRIAMTLADIPLTDGVPDQGTEGIRFMGYTLYDPLIMWDLSSADRPAQLVPGLATAWRRDEADPTKWIFELRRGVRFHDGSTFNADAVIFNLERALNDKAPYYDPKFRGLVQVSIPSVAAWRKLDDYTVELTTNGVDGLMPYQLNRFLIASPAQYEKVGRDWQAFRQAPSGTGPWKLKSFTPRERAELVRNPDYWNPARVPKSEAMVLYPVPDVSARTAALLTGRVDWAEPPAPDTVGPLIAGAYVLNPHTDQPRTPSSAFKTNPQTY